MNYLAGSQNDLDEIGRSGRAPPQASDHDYLQISKPRDAYIKVDLPIKIPGTDFANLHC